MYLKHDLRGPGATLRDVQCLLLALQSGIIPAVLEGLYVMLWSIHMQFQGLTWGFSHAKLVL